MIVGIFCGVSVCRQLAVILLFAAFLDLLIGDPHWLWHPVQGMGFLISHLEQALWRLLGIRAEPEADKGKKRTAGAILAFCVPVLSALAATALLCAADRIHPYLAVAAGVVISAQMLAMKSLAEAAEAVRIPLMRGDTEEARRAVSMIVGRDTAHLDARGITKAAIETVAENTSDGVIAPLFYLFLFGPVGGVVYKAVNTMDSMIGYRNDRYRYFGTAAARLDDVLNYLPSRLGALFMILAAYLTGADGRGAARIWRRDRRKHKSPNSAQTESVCAGALGLQLAGDAWYFGVRVKKETLGDPLRDPAPDDIRRSERLLFVTSALFFAAGELLLLGASLMT